MQPYVGLGNSLQTAQGGAAGGVGGWVELGRTTLGSAGNLDISSLPDKRYYMFLNETLGTGYSAVRFNTDTGTNYSRRVSVDGASDSTATSQTLLQVGEGDGYPGFNVGYIANLSAKEKLLMSWNTEAQTGAGAANAPSRREFAGKWTNTASAISTMNNYNPADGSGHFVSGSEAIVLGWDPADTHTTNFWQELASVNASGSSTNLSSGTITAKKYLWIQCYTEGTGGDIITTFNNDTGSNYTRRYSIDGGADGSDVNQTAIDNMHNAGLPNDDAFSNWFIINNSANEKLIMGHSVQNGSAGAGTAPPRLEFAGKWTNTASQITEIDFDSSSGNFGSNSIIKVWGSD
jgi:hypothetical protein